MIFKKSSIILMMLLPGLYLSDIAYGVLTQLGIDMLLSPGIVIRGGLFVLSVLVSLILSKFINTKILIVVWLIAILALPGLLQSISEEYFFQEIQFLAKVLYGPFLFLLFLVLLRKKIVTTEQILKFIEYTAYFIGVSLFLMQIMKIGNQTYGDYSSGMKGLFHAQNDISLSLILTICVAIYRNIVYPKLLTLLLLIITLLGLLGLGTRSSMIAFIIVPISCIMIMLFAKSNEWTLNRKKAFLVNLLPLFLILFGIGIFKGYEQIAKFDYQINKYEQLLSGDHPRSRLINAGLLRITERNELLNLVGEGGIKYFKQVYLLVEDERENKARRVEVDWIELLGAYGIFLTLYVHACLFVSLIYTLKIFINENQPEIGIIFLMILLYSGHSFFAGHAIVSPIVSTLLSSVLAIIFTFTQVNPHHLVVKHEK